MVLEDIISMVTIYKIWSEKGDKVYIGSATNLATRWHHHRSMIATNSRILFEEYGKDFCKMEPLEEVKVEERDERERYWIEYYGENVVNRKLPGRTDKEYKEDNKDIIKVKSKEYRQRRKDYLQEKVICEQCGIEVSRQCLRRHVVKMHLSKVNPQK